MQSKNPLVSVIVPCYNYAHFLPDLFNSLKKQTYDNWECIVVDDASKDNTEEVVRSFALIDNRINYYSKQNAGAAEARNYGLKLAKGEFIQFIDADDLIGEDKFKVQLGLFEINSALDIVYCGYLFIDSELKKQWKNEIINERLSDLPFRDFINYWEYSLMIPIHSFLFRISCFKKNGAFDSNFKTHEDWDLHLNFSLNGLKYLTHDYIGAYYRIHPSSSSRNDLTRNRKDTSDILAKYRLKVNFMSLEYLLILNRYFEYFVDFIIESAYHKRIRFFTVVQNDMGKFWNLIAFVLSPFYFLKKIIYKIAR
ncbi:MAG: glycosyltransferase [Bacteroidota bacterium]